MEKRLLSVFLFFPLLLALQEPYILWRNQLAPAKQAQEQFLSVASYSVISDVFANDL